MYVLVTLADVVQIRPHEFSKPSARAIEDWINAKYADKVLHKVGLCVGFHSLIDASEGLIGHGDGTVSINVDFRLIVFRPFKGEILLGTITSSDMNDGIFLSSEFFDEIQVPPSVLPDNTIFDPEESLFIWRYQDEESPEEVKEYYFDRAEKCLFRVEMEQWHDLTPQQHLQESPAEGEDGHGRVESLRKAPYALQASMMHSGTGPKIWWLDAAGDEEMLDEELEATAGGEDETS